jgi:HlyD family secretion protein
MIRKWILPVLALAGVLFAIKTVVTGQRQPTPAQPVAAPSRSPFKYEVAGAGIVEASTENIAIGTPVGNIVTEVFVKVGDKVKQGGPLFRLRDSVTLATLDVRKAALAAAKAKLERLKSLPRPEDLPPAEAHVEEAKAQLEDAKNQLALWESVKDPRAVVREDLDKRRYAVKVAEKRLAAAEAELKLLKAGSWAPDIAIAEADVLSADAAVKESEADIERRTIKAPVNAEVFQVKVRPGEYAMTGPLATPLMLLGDTETMHVRVDVDENDAWRIKPNAQAVAQVRGNSSLSTQLQFVRIEPFVVPKKSLTGESSERVDTRVLQILYSFKRGSLPVYVGQQVDVFIEAPPITGSAETPAAAGGQ